MSVKLDKLTLNIFLFHDDFKNSPSMLTLNISPSLAAILDLNENFNSGK